METASGTASAKNRRAAGHKRKQKYRNIKVYDLRMSEEMAMSVPFPEMMSWNIYFFYFELSDNNANILKTIFS